MSTIWRLTRWGSLLCPSKFGTAQMSAKPRRKGRGMQKIQKVKKVSLRYKGFGGSSGTTRKSYVSQLDSIRELLSIFFCRCCCLLPCSFLDLIDRGRLFIILLSLTYYINLLSYSTRHASQYEKIIAAAADFTSGRVWPVNFASETGPKFVWEKVINYFSHDRNCNTSH